MEQPTVTIVGGQIGAGKSRLIPVAKRSLQNNCVTVDFDELRILHPNHNEVRSKYPEWVYQILLTDSERLRDDLQADIIEKRLNVVYEGALRNTKSFCNLARTFKNNGYNVDLYLMSVPQLESYTSTVLRYALDLADDANPRWIERSIHDSSYEGVVNTTQAFIDEDLLSNVRVFKRGKGLEPPIEIYSTQGRQFPSILEALMHGRRTGIMEAVQKFPERYETICQILRSKRPELLPKLEDLRSLYEEESIKMVDHIEKGM